MSYYRKFAVLPQILHLNVLTLNIQGESILELYISRHFLPVTFSLFSGIWLTSLYSHSFGGITNMMMHCDGQTSTKKKSL